ncbi:MAG: transglycosylase domain-containing protein [Ruminococcus sp.]|nr:transglycosylase domain-containing protein [Ruminococcus sp.]
MNNEFLEPQPAFADGQASGVDVRTGPPPRKKKKKKKHSIGFIIFKKLLTVIATTLLSLFLVMIITGTIVATALTVYVLDFMDDSTTITFQELESGNDTFIYGIKTDENGKETIVQLHKVKSNIQRIPISIDKVPQHVRDAFVYTEDERFYTHDGVDYKRTFSAFLNMFMHIYDTEQGGSTITQQLIKNLTGDDEHSPQRKIREIFSAMQLERTYSKDEILEEYLNYISFGGAVNGIELASINYFGKSVEELTTPEAAVLAAIPKSPEEYGPFQFYYEDDDTRKPMVVDGRANNRNRQKYVLYKLYDNGAITYDEYQEYLNTPIIYTDSEEYKKAHPETEIEELKNQNSVYSWALDAIYFEAAEYFMKEFDIEDKLEAIEKINKGGYKIYSKIDDKMQEYVEEKFKDVNNLLDVGSVSRWVDINNDGTVTDDESIPHVAFVALGYDGSVMATVGNWGEKKESLITNYAVTNKRAVGSTIKPISTYGYALEHDMIHWGSVYQDKKVMDVNGQPWPSNYSTGASPYITGASNYVWYWLMKSYNTIPAQIFKQIEEQDGNKALFNFCREKLGMDLYDPNDNSIAPLSIGALSYGLTLENLVNAYIPYGNEGIYNDAHIITKIEDSNNKVIYENNGNPRQAVSDETAWVMNRLLKVVVDQGTATSAKLPNKVLVGKTGTTENWWDSAFVGLTRDFASGVTVGYKGNREDMKLPTYFHACDVWKTIIGDYAQTEYADTGYDFEPVKTVIETPWCTQTGLPAGQYCPKSNQNGYWKSTNCPTCNGGHWSAPANTGGGDTSGGGNAGGGAAEYSGGGDAGAGTADYSGGGNAGGGGAVDYSGGGDAGGGGAVDNSGGGDTGGGGAVDYSGGGDAGGGAVDYGGGDAGGGAVE